MFGIGFMELCIICVVALIFIGPQKLPSLMVDLGKFFVQFRRMSNEVKSNFDDAISEAEKEIEVDYKATSGKDRKVLPTDSKSEPNNNIVCDEASSFERKDIDDLSAIPSEDKT